MDTFKRKNLKLSNDFRWNGCVYSAIRSKSRRGIGQMLRRYSRRKLREELRGGDHNKNQQT